MRLVCCLLAVAAFAIVEDAAAQDGRPGVYQRGRGGARYAPAPYRPGGYYPPQPYSRGGSRQQVAAGSFQRPYPYHLDYYKQRYGGSYDPYFGNLYGPPNVVLAPGFGYGGGYGLAPGIGYGQGVVQPPGVGPVCPHCGQPWPTPLVAPGPVTTPSP